MLRVTVVIIYGRMVLIDCGEGTQVTMKMLGFGFKNIDTILFTHTHGDHITGLCGLLLTIGNSGREKPITIVGQKGIEEIVNSLLVVAKEIPFELEFIELDEELKEINLGEDEGVWRESTTSGPRQLHPLIFTSSGGMGPKAKCFYSKLAEAISEKKQQPG